MENIAKFFISENTSMQQNIVTYKVMRFDKKNKLIDIEEKPKLDFSVNIRYLRDYKC